MKMINKLDMSDLMVTRILDLKPSFSQRFLDLRLISRLVQVNLSALVYLKNQFRTCS